MSSLVGDYWRLPADIIIEILARLPLKSILRFKCVCKSWRLLLDDVKFCKIHDDIQQKINNPIKIITGKGNVLYWINAYNNSHDTILSGINKIVDHPLYDKRYENYDSDSELGIVGYCNGLVCIRPRLNRICFWNVSPKEHKMLPEVKLFDQSKLSLCKYGFGYDTKTLDYKLVRFEIFEDKCRGTQIKVYSLASNSWSTALYMPYTLSCGPRQAAVYLNGALHFLTDDFKHLVSFDLGDGIISEVPGPVRGNFLDNNRYHKYVDVLGGFLCMVCILPGVRGDLWVMKDYGVRESWTKEFTVPWQAIEFEYFRPIGYVGKRKQVLLNVELKNTKKGNVDSKKGNVLVRYKQNRKIAKILKTHDLIDPKWSHACTYQESLFLVPGKRNSVGILHYLDADQAEQEGAFLEPDHKRRKIIK